MDLEEARRRYETLSRENAQSIRIRGQDDSTERSVQQAQQSSAPPTLPDGRAAAEKSVERVAEMSILPPVVEDPALALLPHIERSAFLRARAKQAPLAPVKGSTGRLAGQRQVQSSLGASQGKQRQSALTSASQVNGSTRRRLKSCRQCGHEQTDNGTGTDISRKEPEGQQTGRGSAHTL